MAHKPGLGKGPVVAFEDVGVVARVLVVAVVGDGD